ncbi:unnamed protein product [Cunninghamella blakesleeana]
MDSSISSIKVHRIAPDYNECPKKMVFKNESEFEEWINNTVKQHGIFLRRESRKSISSSSSYLFEKYPSARVFLHSEYYLCEHAGKRRRNTKILENGVKRRCVKKKSIKDGCTAKYNKRSFSDGTIEVIYNWKHTTHDPCTMEDISRSRLPKEVHDWISDHVDKQMNWKSIKPLLNLNHHPSDNIENTSQQSSAIPASLLVNYHHVKNVIRNRSNLSSKEDSSDTESEDWNHDSTHNA